MSDAEAHADGFELTEVMSASRSAVGWARGPDDRVAVFPRRAPGDQLDAGPANQGTRVRMNVNAPEWTLCGGGRRRDRRRTEPTKCSLQRGSTWQSTPIEVPQFSWRPTS